MSTQSAVLHGHHQVLDCSTRQSPALLSIFVHRAGATMHHYNEEENRWQDWAQGVHADSP